MSENPSRRERYHHGDLARATAEAAFAMVEIGGLASLSMRQIASSLGVTHKALSRHYENGHALQAAVAAIAFERLADAVKSVPCRHEFCRAYIRFALHQPNIYALMMSGFDPAPPALRAAMLRLVSEAQRTFESDDAAKRAWLVLHGGLALHTNRILEPRDAAELESFLVALAV